MSRCTCRYMVRPCLGPRLGPRCPDAPRCRTHSCSPARCREGMCIGLHPAAAGASAPGGRRVTAARTVGRRRDSDDRRAGAIVGDPSGVTEGPPMRARTSARTALVAGLTALVLGLTGTSAAAQDTDGRPARHGPHTSYLLDPVGPAADDVYPEGVAARGGTFYVSSTTDGTIYRGTVTRPVARPFLPGGADDRTSAVGLELAGRTLFVAGGATGRV